MVKDLPWTDLKSPLTTQERIQYLQACLAHFATVTQPIFPSSKLTIHPHATDCRVPRCSIARARPLAVPSSARFRCVVCDKECGMHANAPVLANPYSQWLVLQCIDCAAVAQAE